MANFYEGEKPGLKGAININLKLDINILKREVRFFSDIVFTQISLINTVVRPNLSPFPYHTVCVRTVPHRVRTVPHRVRTAFVFITVPFFTAIVTVTVPFFSPTVRSVKRTEPLIVTVRFFSI